MVHGFVANLRVVTSLGDPVRKLINCATQPFRFCKQEDRNEAQGKIAATHSGLAVVNPNAAAIDIGATMHVAAVALTAHPTRFAVLGLSLLICTGWLIGLRECGVKTVSWNRPASTDPDF